MADITISYKGATIAEISASGTTTLGTSGKYCEDDITLQYVKPSGGGSYIGGTVAWNQMLKEMNSTNYVATAAGTTVSISDGAATVTAGSRYNGIVCASVNRPSIPTGHKVFGMTMVKLTTAVADAIVMNAQNSGNVKASATTDWQVLANIWNWDSTKLAAMKVMDFRSTGFDAFKVKNCMFFDLTAMFGSSIADYAYTLESGTAGAGIAWLKANGFFTKDYYPYDVGTLKSVETFAHPFKDSNGKIIGYFPMNFDLELRGIPKLDANNVLYYDGDEYDGNGTVTRKYGIRAYTSGDATDGSTMITDGTNTVYKLATPTTETV